MLHLVGHPTGTHIYTLFNIKYTVNNIIHKRIATLTLESISMPSISSLSSSAALLPRDSSSSFFTEAAAAVLLNPAAINSFLRLALAARVAAEAEALAPAISLLLYVTCGIVSALGGCAAAAEGDREGDTGCERSSLTVLSRRPKRASAAPSRSYLFVSGMTNAGSSIISRVLLDGLLPVPVFFRPPFFLGSPVDCDYIQMYIRVEHVLEY